MRESGFWNYLKPKLEEIKRSWWQRIESPVTSGIPDLHSIIEGEIFWFELKYLSKWEEGLGTSPIQRNWQKRWCDLGGRAFTLARIGLDIVLIPGHLMDASSGDNVWKSRSCYTSRVGGGAHQFNPHDFRRALFEGCK